MTIQRGKDLLNQSNPSANELKRAISSLNQEKKYVENCIELGFREQNSGQIVVDEISNIITQLEQKLECLTN
jgi:predicted phage-related endonuclease